MSTNVQNQKRRRLTGAKMFLISALLIFIVGVFLGFFDGGEGGRAGPASGADPWIIVAVAALIMILAFIFSAIWMHGLDELAQRAHYEAWYWGGSLGLAGVGFVIAAAPALERVVDLERLLTPLAIHDGPSAAFVSGAVATVIVMAIGYGLWWIVFWLRRR